MSSGCSQGKRILRRARLVRRTENLSEAQKLERLVLDECINVDLALSLVRQKFLQTSSLKICLPQRKYHDEQILRLLNGREFLVFGGAVTVPIYRTENP
jgi:hypothetical protein